MALPQSFGRYLLLEKIASGGMAEIFRAKLIGVEGFEKNVVIKRILPVWSERSDFIAMLVDEAKILVHLNHPNIVQVFELGREEENYYIAMEYVEGVDLRQLVKKTKELKRSIPISLVLWIMVESLKGLHYAHQRSLKEQGPLGIVHRDVSPQNIMLSFEGQVKVADFGIAKAMIKSHETQTGVLKGKYAYMSPEQALGMPLDARSDLFACGILLYELLFMRRLFSSATDIETLDKVRKAEIPWPENLPEDFPPSLKEILTKSLALKPEDRFESAEPFEMALEALLPKPRPTGKDLAAFMAEIFAPEIQDLRQRNEKIHAHTQSFRRQTRVSPPPDEPTISLVETATEVEAAKAQPLPPPKKWKWLGSLALGLSVLIAIVFFAMRSRENAPGNTQTAEVLQAPALPAQALKLKAPESLPSQAMQVSPTPSPKPLSSIEVSTEPPQAHLELKFLDKKLEGKGKLVAKDLPLGTQITARAELKGYESENKSFQILADPLNVNQVLRLKKTAPAFGGISVNAVPWGKVSMPGYIGGSETPVSRPRIPEGTYRVTVSNPSLGKSVSASATIRAGKTTRCTADLEGRAAMACR